MTAVAVIADRGPRRYLSDNEKGARAAVIGLAQLSRLYGPGSDEMWKLRRVDITSLGMTSDATSPNALGWWDITRIDTSINPFLLGPNFNGAMEAGAHRIYRQDFIAPAANWPAVLTYCLPTPIIIPPSHQLRVRLTVFGSFVIPTINARISIDYDESEVIAAAAPIGSAASPVESEWWR